MPSNRKPSSLQTRSSPRFKNHHQKSIENEDLSSLESSENSFDLNLDDQSGFITPTSKSNKPIRKPDLAKTPDKKTDSENRNYYVFLSDDNEDDDEDDHS